MENNPESGLKIKSPSFSSQGLARYQKKLGLLVLVLILRFLLF